MDALEKSFCRKMGVDNIAEYLPTYIKLLKEGTASRNLGRKTQEMLLRNLKIHGYFSDTEKQLFDEGND